MKAEQKSSSTASNYDGGYSSNQRFFHNLHKSSIKSRAPESFDDDSRKKTENNNEWRNISSPSKRSQDRSDPPNDSSGSIKCEYQAQQNFFRSLSQSSIKKKPTCRSRSSSPDRAGNSSSSSSKTSTHNTRNNNDSSGTSFGATSSIGGSYQANQLLLHGLSQSSIRKKAQPDPLEDAPSSEVRGHRTSDNENPSIKKPYARSPSPSSKSTDASNENREAPISDPYQTKQLLFHNLSQSSIKRKPQVQSASLQASPLSPSTRAKSVPLTRSPPSPIRFAKKSSSSDPPKNSNVTQTLVGDAYNEARSEFKKAPQSSSLTFLEPQEVEKLLSRVENQNIACKVTLQSESFASRAETSGKSVEGNETSNKMTALGARQVQNQGSRSMINQTQYLEAALDATIQKPKQQIRHLQNQRENERIEKDKNLIDAALLNESKKQDLPAALSLPTKSIASTPTEHIVAAADLVLKEPNQSKLLRRENSSKVRLASMLARPPEASAKAASTSENEPKITESLQMPSTDKNATLSNKGHQSESSIQNKHSTKKPIVSGTLGFLQRSLSSNNGSGGSSKKAKPQSDKKGAESSFDPTSSSLVKSRVPLVSAVPTPVCAPTPPPPPPAIRTSSGSIRPYESAIRNSNNNSGSSDFTHVRKSVSFSTDKVKNSGGNNNIENGSSSMKSSIPKKSKESLSSSSSLSRTSRNSSMDGTSLSSDLSFSHKSKEMAPALSGKKSSFDINTSKEGKDPGTLLPSSVRMAPSSSVRSGDAVMQKKSKDLITSSSGPSRKTSTSDNNHSSIPPKKTGMMEAILEKKSKEFMNSSKSLLRRNSSGGSSSGVMKASSDAIALKKLKKSLSLSSTSTQGKQHTLTSSKSSGISGSNICDGMAVITSKAKDESQTTKSLTSTGKAGFSLTASLSRHRRSQSYDASTSRKTKDLSLSINSGGISDAAIPKKSKIKILSSVSTSGVAMSPTNISAGYYNNKNGSCEPVSDSTGAISSGKLKKSSSFSRNSSRDNDNSFSEIVAVKKKKKFSFSLRKPSSGKLTGSAPNSTSNGNSDGNNSDAVIPKKMRSLSSSSSSTNQKIGTLTSNSSLSHIEGEPISKKLKDLPPSPQCLPAGNLSISIRRMSSSGSSGSQKDQKNLTVITLRRGLNAGKNGSSSSNSSEKKEGSSIDFSGRSLSTTTMEANARENRHHKSSEHEDISGRDAKDLRTKSIDCDQSNSSALPILKIRPSSSSSGNGSSSADKSAGRDIKQPTETSTTTNNIGGGGVSRTTDRLKRSSGALNTSALISMKLGGRDASDSFELTTKTNNTNGDGAVSASRGTISSSIDKKSYSGVNLVTAGTTSAPALSTTTPKMSSRSSNNYGTTRAGGNCEDKLFCAATQPTLATNISRGSSVNTSVVHPTEGSNVEDRIPKKVSALLPSSTNTLISKGGGSSNAITPSIEPSFISRALSRETRPNQSEVQHVAGGAAADGKLRSLLITSTIGKSNNNSSSSSRTDALPDQSIHPIRVTKVATNQTAPVRLPTTSSVNKSTSLSSPSLPPPNSPSSLSNSQKSSIASSSQLASKSNSNNSRNAKSALSMASQFSTIPKKISKKKDQQYHHITLPVAVHRARGSRLVGKGINSSSSSSGSSGMLKPISGNNHDISQSSAAAMSILKKESKENSAKVISSAQATSLTAMDNIDDEVTFVAASSLNTSTKNQSMSNINTRAIQKDVLKMGSSNGNNTIEAENINSRITLPEHQQPKISDATHINYKVQSIQKSQQQQETRPYTLLMDKAANDKCTTPPIDQDDQPSDQNYNAKMHLQESKQLIRKKKKKKKSSSSSTTSLASMKPGLIDARKNGKERSGKKTGKGSISKDFDKSAAQQHAVSAHSLNTSDQLFQQPHIKKKKKKKHKSSSSKKMQAVEDVGKNSYTASISNKAVLHETTTTTVSEGMISALPLHQQLKDTSPIPPHPNNEQTSVISVVDNVKVNNNTVSNDMKDINQIKQIAGNDTSPSADTTLDVEESTLTIQELVQQRLLHKQQLDRNNPIEGKRRRRKKTPPLKPLQPSTSSKTVNDDFTLTGGIDSSLKSATSDELSKNLRLDTDVTTITNENVTKSSTHSKVKNKTKVSKIHDKHNKVNNICHDDKIEHVTNSGSQAARSEIQEANSTITNTTQVSFHQIFSSSGSTNTAVVLDTTVLPSTKREALHSSAVNLGIKCNIHSKPMSTNALQKDDMLISGTNADHNDDNDDSKNCNNDCIDDVNREKSIDPPSNIERVAKEASKIVVEVPTKCSHAPMDQNEFLDAKNRKDIPVFSLHPEVGSKAAGTLAVTGESFRSVDNENLNAAQKISQQLQPMIYNNSKAVLATVGVQKNINNNNSNIDGEEAEGKDANIVAYNQQTFDDDTIDPNDESDINSSFDDMDSDDDEDASIASTPTTITNMNQFSTATNAGMSSASIKKEEEIPILINKDNIIAGAENQFYNIKADDDAEEYDGDGEEYDSSADELSPPPGRSSYRKATKNNVSDIMIQQEYQKEQKALVEAKKECESSGDDDELLSSLHSRNKRKKKNEQRLSTSSIYRTQKSTISNLRQPVKEDIQERSISPFSSKDKVSRNTIDGAGCTSVEAIKNLDLVNAEHAMHSMIADRDGNDSDDRDTASFASSSTAVSFDDEEDENDGGDEVVEKQPQHERSIIIPSTKEEDNEQNIRSNTSNFSGDVPLPKSKIISVDDHDIFEHKNSDKSEDADDNTSLSSCSSDDEKAASKSLSSRKITSNSHAAITRNLLVEHGTVKVSTASHQEMETQEHPQQNEEKSSKTDVLPLPLQPSNINHSRVIMNKRLKARREQNQLAQSRQQPKKLSKKISTGKSAATNPLVRVSHKKAIIPTLGKESSKVTKTKNGSKLTTSIISGEHSVKKKAPPKSRKSKNKSENDDLSPALSTTKALGNTSVISPGTAAIQSFIEASVNCKEQARIASKSTSATRGNSKDVMKLTASTSSAYASSAAISEGGRITASSASPKISASQIRLTRKEKETRRVSAINAVARYMPEIFGDFSSNEKFDQFDEYTSTSSVGGRRIINTKPIPRGIKWGAKIRPLQDKFTGRCKGLQVMIKHSVTSNKDRSVDASLDVIKGVLKNDDVIIGIDGLCVLDMNCRNAQIALKQCVNPKNKSINTSALESGLTRTTASTFSQSSVTSKVNLNADENNERDYLITEKSANGDEYKSPASYSLTVLRRVNDEALVVEETQQINGLISQKKINNNTINNNERSYSLSKTLVKCTNVGCQTLPILPPYPSISSIERRGIVRKRQVDLDDTSSILIRESQGSSIRSKRTKFLNNNDECNQPTKTVLPSSGLLGDASNDGTISVYNDSSTANCNNSESDVTTSRLFQIDKFSNGNKADAFDLLVGSNKDGHSTAVTDGLPLKKLQVNHDQIRKKVGQQVNNFDCGIRDDMNKSTGEINKYVTKTRAVDLGRFGQKLVDLNNNAAAQAIDVEEKNRNKYFEKASSARCTTENDVGNDMDMSISSCDNDDSDCNSTQETLVISSQILSSLMGTSEMVAAASKKKNEGDDQLNKKLLGNTPRPNETSLASFSQHFEHLIQSNHLLLFLLKQLQIEHYPDASVEDENANPLEKLKGFKIKEANFSDNYSLETSNYHNSEKLKDKRKIQCKYCKKSYLTLNKLSETKFMSCVMMHMKLCEKCPVEILKKLDTFRRHEIDEDYHHNNSYDTKEFFTILREKSFSFNFNDDVSASADEEALIDSAQAFTTKHSVIASTDDTTQYEHEGNAKQQQKRVNRADTSSSDSPKKKLNREAQLNKRKMKEKENIDPPKKKRKWKRRASGELLSLMPTSNFVDQGMTEMSERNSTSASKKPLRQASGLIFPSDRDKIIGYEYVLLQQVQPCQAIYNNSKRVGVECVHCRNASSDLSSGGGGGNGKSSTDSVFCVYPSKRTIQSSLIVSCEEHLLSCKHCPESQLDLLNDLKSKQMIEYTKVKPNVRAEFFSDIWVRLNEYNFDAYDVSNSS